MNIKGGARAWWFKLLAPHFIKSKIIQRKHLFTLRQYDKIIRKSKVNINIRVPKEEKDAMNKDKNQITIRSSAAEYLTYVASVGDQVDSIEMRYEDENIWLTQRMLSTLYDVDVRTISDHIQKIYLDNELIEDATIRNYRIVQTDIYATSLDYDASAKTTRRFFAAVQNKMHI